MQNLQKTSSRNFGWTNGSGRRGFFKTRDLAAEVIESGHLRLNSQPLPQARPWCDRRRHPHLPQGRAIRVIRVLALSERRGPAIEAQALYHDLAPDPSAALE